MRFAVSEVAQNCLFFEFLKLSPAVYDSTIVSCLFGATPWVVWHPYPGSASSHSWCFNLRDSSMTQNLAGWKVRKFLIWAYTGNFSLFKSRIVNIQSISPDGRQECDSCSSSLLWLGVHMFWFGVLQLILCICKLCIESGADGFFWLTYSCHKVHCTSLFWIIYSIMFTARVITFPFML